MKSLTYAILVKIHIISHKKNYVRNYGYGGPLPENGPEVQSLAFRSFQNSDIIVKVLRFESLTVTIFFANFISILDAIASV